MNSDSPDAELHNCCQQDCQRASSSENSTACRNAISVSKNQFVTVTLQYVYNVHDCI